MLSKNYMKLLVVYIFILNNVFAQNVASAVEKKINWKIDSENINPIITNYTLAKSKLAGILVPTISENFETTTKQEIIFSNFEYQLYNGSQTYKTKVLATLKGEVKPKVYYTMDGNTGFTGYILCPFKEENGQLYQLISFNYQAKDGKAFDIATQKTAKRTISNSVLAAGEWFKFSVNKDGIYKIDANMLTSAGININNINPKTLKLYSHQGGMLSENNADFRFDDLPENAIQVIGESDGIMNAGDYILFYAQSPHKWKFDVYTNEYKHETNIYSDKTFFFLTFGGTEGKRMNTAADGNNLTANNIYSTFNYHTFHEQDIENLCKEGRFWYGEKFDQVSNYQFTHDLSQFDLSKDFKLVFQGGAISPTSSQIACRTLTSTLGVQNYFAINGSSEEPCINRVFPSRFNFNVVNPNLILNFTYIKPTADSKAFIDYYELHGERSLSFNSGFHQFSVVKSNLDMVAEYNLTGLPSTFQLFDVSDPINPKIQNTVNNSGIVQFKSTGNGILREYAVNDGNLAIPFYEGKVANQNLHVINNVQFIIVSHPDFLAAANKLADWHRTRDNMEVLVTTPQLIYNEFSSGSQDISAIRDFFKHVYYNSTPSGLKYAMFMGDASFDYKDKIKNNTNFVPVYQSEEGIYCSDDFYGYLDPLDGEWSSNNEQKLEIAVTRLPAANTQEAMGMVNKIINYKDVKSLGDWRNSVTFCADDFDHIAGWETIFVTDFEDIFKGLDANFKNINVRKIYTDAYKQENVGGSQRYPEAQAAIVKGFEKGTLIFNYIGHGGVNYLASEKIFDVSMINNLNNINSLPVFFTATCEFSKFDDATYKSAGEFLITNKNGGAVAMFTTTRLVYADANAEITKYFWDNCAFVKTGGKWPTIGDIYKKLKNRESQNFNDRKFTLFADPAMVMNYPENEVKIDSINDEATGNGNDTIKALSKVTFTGHIEDISGNKLNTFNGILDPTIYDKISILASNGNDAYNFKANYKDYANVLYKGKTSVKNGDFKFSFVVPKDIAYNYGFGKISLYAENGITDASGSLASLVVGGSASNIVVDNNGPKIELFIDDYSFVSGGITDKTPLLMAKIFDENGINASGSGIGRDIMAYIDKGTENEKSFVLNSFYTAKLNSYTEGEVRYQLENLAEGKHTYTLKVWDVFNNPSENTIEFNITNNNKFGLKNVLNYPNPFSNQTTFLFNHNRAGQNLNVTLSIFSITGKVVKTIEQYIPSAEGYVSEITWGGKDEFDDKLASGIYIFRLFVKTDEGEIAEKTQKLVILN